MTMNPIIWKIMKNPSLPLIFFRLWISFSQCHNAYRNRTNRPTNLCEHRPWYKKSWICSSSLCCQVALSCHYEKSISSIGICSFSGQYLNIACHFLAEGLYFCFMTICPSRLADLAYLWHSSALTNDFIWVFFSCEITLDPCFQFWFFLDNI